MKKVLLTMCITVGFLLGTQSAFAGTSISVNFGMIPVAPYYAVCEYRQADYIWVEGHYCNDRPRRVWVPGYWSRSPHHHERYMHRPAGYQKYHREERHQGGTPGRYERSGRYGGSEHAGYQHNPEEGRQDHRHYNEPGSGRQYRQEREEGRQGYTTNVRESGGQYRQNRNEGREGYGHDEPGSGNWMKNLNDRVIRRQLSTRQASR